MTSREQQRAQVLTRCVDHDLAARHLPDPRDDLEGLAATRLSLGDGRDGTVAGQALEIDDLLLRWILTARITVLSTAVADTDC